MIEKKCLRPVLEYYEQDLDKLRYMQLKMLIAVVVSALKYPTVKRSHVQKGVKGFSQNKELERITNSCLGVLLLTKILKYFSFFSHRTFNVQIGIGSL